jgi:protein-S-isoprenylcysteine O-methyltransferase Ste14
MRNITGFFILGGRATLFIVWIAMAFSAKRTIEKPGRRPLVLAIGLVIVGLVSLRAGWSLPVLGFVLLPHSLTSGIVADLIAFAGLAVAILARRALGGNWSTVAAVKEDHELIIRGPYRFVRHPIYSGILLMLIGTAIESGRLSAFAGVAVVAIGFWIKARQEEELLAQQFPTGYPAYAARTKALVPGLL